MEMRKRTRGRTFRSKAKALRFSGLSGFCACLLAASLGLAPAAASHEREGDGDEEKNEGPDLPIESEGSSVQRTERVLRMSPGGLVRPCSGRRVPREGRRWR